MRITTSIRLEKGWVTKIEGPQEVIKEIEETLNLMIGEVSKRPIRIIPQTPHCFGFKRTSRTGNVEDYIPIELNYG